jgi:putative Mn2+ efflux pump MntP
MQTLGYIAFIFIALGFSFNSSETKKHWAFIFWVIGDLLFIVFNLIIGNYPHILTNLLIIGINIKPLYQAIKNKLYRKDLS